VHLFERECSIQRRHQKVLEETPSPFLDDAMRHEMGETAVAAARAIDYRGAGTVEFIVGADRRFFFMEMNTRLQVEHPVTEMITGEDLVEWQLRVAAGEPLPLMQSEIHAAGHAIEVRLCAENPDNDFLPETGRIRVLRAPEASDEVRLDTGVREGDEVSVFYDPMIAKLIAWGSDRAESARRLQEALAQTALMGVKTNLAFLERVVRHPAFLRGETDTAFIERHRADLLGAAAPPLEALAAACLKVFLDERQENAARPPSPWNDVTGWRLNQPSRREIELALPGGDRVTIRADMMGDHAIVHCAGKSHRLAGGPAQGDRLQLSLDGETYFARVLRMDESLGVILPQGRYDLVRIDPFHYEPVDALPDARLTALMPGRVVKVMAAAGDSVAKGQALLILEAMKMEHTITSPREGVIERVAFAENDLVPADALLVTFRE
jgi:3-methylcrotonyl-CoA carboxylase alpha subunit